MRVSKPSSVSEFEIKSGVMNVVAVQKMCIRDRSPVVLLWGPKRLKITSTRIATLVDHGPIARIVCSTMLTPGKLDLRIIVMAGERSMKGLIILSIICASYIAGR